MMKDWERDLHHSVPHDPAYIILSVHCDAGTSSVFIPYMKYRECCLALVAWERSVLQDCLGMASVVAADVAGVLLQDSLADSFVVSQAVEDAGEG